MKKLRKKFVTQLNNPRTNQKITLKKNVKYWDKNFGNFVSEKKS